MKKPELRKVKSADNLLAKAGLEDRVLDLIDESNEMTRSDIQGRLQRILMDYEVSVNKK